MHRCALRNFDLAGTVLAICLFLLAASPALAEDGLFHQWRFHPQQLQGKTVQASAGSRDARLVGSPTFDKGPPAALSLDGKTETAQRAVIADDIAQVELPREDISVEAWVLIEQPIEWGGICGVIQDNGDYERGWLLGYRDAHFSFAVATESKQRLTYLTDPRLFEPGYWYHVVGTYDGKEQKLFVDGKFRVQSDHQSGPIAYPPKAVYVVGAYQDQNELRPLAGKIEQVSVYRRALSADEVAARFHARSSEFPDIHAVVPKVDGWPTYLHDNQRTGISHEHLKLPLHLQWVYRANHPPQPAWPRPAKQDFWHKKYNLKPRVVYDRAYHVVSVGDLACFASSADDKVYGLDAATGRERWTFFAEGPVRLAPTIASGKVLFGSDDGYVYCLNAADGSLVWKIRCDAVDERWIPGNGRVISTMPVRSSVLVDDQVALFCTGLFPRQGVFQVAVDLASGRKLADGKIGVSAQGYLERRAGRLYIPTGRNPAGAFAARLQRRGKGVGREISRLPEEYAYAFIGAEGVRLGGGDGKVSVFDDGDGRKLWTAPVEGKAYGLAISDGRLFVSTDQGLIYCFASNAGTPNRIEPQRPKPIAYPNDDVAGRYAAAAERILTESAVRRGYCLVLGSRRGRLAYELARQSELQVVCDEPDAELVAASRSDLDQAGLYGRVVVHHRSASGDLPYTDYLFNLVVSDAVALGKSYEVKRSEVLRVLRPGGGVAYFGPGKDEIVRREPLDGIGEWTHMYANPANTACSTDQRVQGAMALQWFGKPGPRQMLNRHHRTVAPLWKNGRLFVPGDDRIFAADAYNGTPLWKVEIPNSRRVAAFRDCSYMAAGDQALFVAAGDHCLALDPKSGRTQHTFHLPPVSDKQERDWGFVATLENRLIGSGIKPGASRREHTRKSISEGAYYDFRDVVCSDFLFAYDSLEKQHQWTYEAAGPIINSTITIGEQKVFFVESNNEEALKSSTGRHQLPKLLKPSAELVALDLNTGQVLWRVPAACTEVAHNLYAAQASGKVVLVGSRNSGIDRATARVLYDICVRDAGNGKAVWQTTQTQQSKIGGDHGEQDLHPVIVGEKLFCEPIAYELHTGKRIADWGWNLKKRSGCGTISASASTLFFRQSTPTMFDLITRQRQPVTTSTRPGCWINMIPAGGLLLIPEASSGCTCDYAVQTSLAFLPVR